MQLVSFRLFSFTVGMAQLAKKLLLLLAGDTQKK